MLFFEPPGKQILAVLCREQVYYVILDLRVFDTGGVSSGGFQYQNISFGHIGWFVRECTDADPENALLVPTEGMQVRGVDNCQRLVSVPETPSTDFFIAFQPGCSSHLTSGDAMLVFCLFLMSPIFLRMNGSSTSATTVAALLAYAFSCMSVGYLNGHFFWSLILQMAAAMSSSLLCHWKEKQAKNDYAQVMAIRFSADQFEHLLQTLIPPGVLKKFGVHKRTTTYAAQPISNITVMFCMFDYKVLTRDDFDFIESLVADLDKAVEKSGMKSSNIQNLALPNCLASCNLTRSAGS